MGFTVRLTNNKLGDALKRFAEKHLPEQLTAATGVVAAEVCEQVAATVPSASGRLSEGWTEAGELARAGGGEGRDARVTVLGSGSETVVEVTCLVPYAAVVELGDEGREAGNQLAVALETTRRRLVYGRGEGSLGAAIQQAWEDATR